MWQPEQELSEKFVNTFSNAHMDYELGAIGWRVYGRFRLAPHLWETKKVALSNVFVPKEKQQQGIGTSMLNAVTDFLDQHKLTCYVFVEPYGENPMSLRQLKRWYGRFGFKSVRGEKQLMVYRPQ